MKTNEEEEALEEVEIHLHPGSICVPMVLNSSLFEAAMTTDDSVSLWKPQRPNNTRTKRA